MKKIYFFFLFLIFIGINSNVHAQLTGAKTIPGNYPTIATAIADLNTQGVGIGGVTFNVASGHTETSSNLVIAFTLNPPTISNQVVFQKNGAGANPLITAAPGVSSALDGIIKLSGADYITFDRIDLLDPASNTGDAAMEWGYVFLRKDSLDGSQNNIIKNCAITLQKINSIAYGIFVVNRNLEGVVISADDPAGQNSFNKFWGNAISDVDKGIFLQGTSLLRDVDNEVGVNGQAPNNIANFGGSLLSAVTADGVRCEGQINVKINNNIINGGAGTGGSSAVFGIIATLFGATGSAPNYEISHNQITVTTGATSQATFAIRALATADTVWIHHNIVEDCNAAQNTTGFNALVHDPTGTTNTAYIYNNIVRNNTHSGTGTSTLLGGVGGINFSHVHDNEVYGNRKTGVSGTMYCIRAANGRTDCESNIIYDNSIPNSSGTSASTIYGYQNSDLDPATENVFNNMIYNLSIGGSGTSASHIVAGIRSASDALTTKDFYGNIIYGLSGVSGNTTTGGVIGIWSTSGTTINIHRNKIYDLTNNGPNGSTVGCWVSSGTTIQIDSNLISDLKAPNSGNANGVIGINSTSTAANSTIGIHYNSVYLTAAGSATFGSSGVSVAANATATTATVEMQNNIIINLSTPGSTSGFTVAYRRSSANLANYAATSDFNNFYAGTPSVNRLIYFDGTTGDITLAAYKARVAPRDANSVSGLIKTLNLTINFEACTETDTITVELRSAIPPYNVIDVAVGLGGQSAKHVFNFDNATDTGNYYIVVKHRNSIETWSKFGGEDFSLGILNYDFTSSASQAFGNNMVNVGGEWSIYTGDVNQDGVVDLTDMGLIDNDAFNFVTGYVSTDLNCDEFVDLTDLGFADNNASNFVAVVRP
ncbi:MAG: hypothetical protein M3R36_14460 [Bacteroidota bacterium]|nr:hypothetical protein [Bacteroidota bacterium]